ncbi:ABC transporter ATP-binding protein [Litchfieldella qijiaojingensis]|uniref:ABC transporter ATP-binding protein n=1 Tax=Litchfieldella qijiaojingensis TaxID=980347 RepID=A0ABQ2YN02_9GAMM|nr:ABC transporter ATP-binding protein [Halomonas qijiaojingensis]GGX89864.1 ABC transporter ATP-binding protein [Halomonas qijiaojingensis]
MTTQATEDEGLHNKTSRSSGALLLEVQGLVRDFDSLRALDGADLSVREGTITGLIGPNGAGKTTLFNVVTGFHLAQAGRVIFNGKDITNLPPHRVFQHGLCRTFQIPREHQSLSVLENLMLIPPGQQGERLFNTWFRPGAVRRQELANRDKALEVLEFVELDHLHDEYARNLSGGQKKLLELARTLMTDPQLVLLDEPGAGVNPTLMHRLTDNIRYLNRERGITFLVIEHDMDLIMSLCDPVVVMSEGRQLMTGSPEEVRRNPRVLEAYLGGQYAAVEG